VRYADETEEEDIISNTVMHSYAFVIEIFVSIQYKENEPYLSYQSIIIYIYMCTYMYTCAAF